jgi:PAS domain S-box-containing protein
MDNLLNSENSKTVTHTPEVYKNIFENAFDAILLIDNESKYVDANISVCNLSGYTKEELLNMKVGDLTPEKYINHGKELWKEFLEKGTQKGSYILQRKDGKEINVEFSALANIGEGLHLFFFKDITENIKIGNNLLREKEMWFSILNDLPAYVCIQDKNLDIVYSNKYLQENFGPIEGRRCHEIFYGDKNKSREPCLSCDIHKIYEEEGVSTREKTHINGRTYFVYDYSYTDIEKNKYVLGIGFDITERKLAQKSLGERENTLQGIFVASPVGINLIQNRTFVWCNEIMSQITGYPLEEIIGKNTRFLYLSDADYEKAGYNYAQKFSEGKVAEVETRWMRKDGAIIDIHKKMSLLEQKDPSKGYITSVMDITERKRVEEKLITANKQLEDIIEFLPDATFIIDKNKTVIAWNMTMEKMTGVKKEDIIGKGHEYTTLPFYGEKRPYLVDLLFDDSAEIKSKYNFVKKEGRSLYAETYTPALYNNEGAYVWAIASPLLDQKGNIVGAIEAIRDISEFKDAEQRIAESERTLRSILTAAPVGIKLVKNRQIIWCNQSMLEMTDYDFEELSNKNLKFLYPNEEEYNKVGHMLYDKWNNQEYREIETVWKRSNGELIYGHIRISPIDPSDHSKGMIEVITDVTQRKKAQKQLDENLEYFAHLVDHIRNPLAILSGFVQVEVDNESTKNRVQRQVNRIEEIIVQLDQGWMDTEDTRKFLKRYMR